MKSIFSLGILDKYILKKYMQTFFYSVLLFTLIAIFIDISEKMDDFIKRKPPLSVLIFEYYIFFIPYFMGLFSSVFVFLSTLFFNSKLAQNTEIIAILNSGLKYPRFLKPYLIGAAILCTLFLLLNSHVLPYCDKYRLKFEDDWIREHKQTQNNNIYNMLDENNIIHMESFNYEDSVGFNFTLEAFRDGKLVERTFANRLLWNREKGCWTLDGYYRRLFSEEGDKLMRGIKMDTVLKIKPDEFVVRTNYVSSMTNPELNEYIRKETEKGNPKVSKYKVELYKRTMVPVAFFVLTLLAVAVSSRKSRGGTGFHLGIGIFMTFSYLLFMQVFNTMGNTGVMAPWLAVWFPTLFFFGVALVLLKKAPK
ncbi:MAG: LptF/LptG family permease [Bacteroidetes bacterium]|nr:LptF/LptG family permease [Bacteroidota bacterium]MCK6611622.1 LptF/LptG family permease [Bacteroidia bacterium]